MFLVVVALLASGALYALRGDVVIYRNNLTIEPSARLLLALDGRLATRCQPVSCTLCNGRNLTSG